MGRLVAAVRSALAVAAVIVWIWLGGIYQRLVLWPASALLPGRKRALVSAYMRVMARVILGLLGLGGRARCASAPCPPRGPSSCS